RRARRPLGRVPGDLDRALRLAEGGRRPDRAVDRAADTDGGGTDHLRPVRRGQPAPLPYRCRGVGPVKTLLNIIWFVLAGLWLAIGYVLAGVICCVLIVTIPWGIASYRLANYVAWPFGRE